MDQCVEEVEAKPDGDDQSDDRFTHSLSPKADAGRGRRRPSTPKHQTERHERDVEHVRLLTEALLGPTPRKLSIATWAAGRRIP
jgi:hypothetical protein